MNLSTWIKSLEDERQAFLDAINEEPWDVTHRLVYADWLAEHGDNVREDGQRYMARMTEECMALAFELAHRVLYVYGLGQVQACREIRTALDRTRSFLGERGHKRLAQYVLREVIAEKQ